MSFLGQEEQLREFQDRFRYVYFGIPIALLIVIGRLLYLQIFNGDEMRQYSEENRIKRVTIEAPRGMIFDRNRKLLIDNQPSFDLEITPQYLRDTKTRQTVLKKLAEILNVTDKSLEEKITAAKNQPAFFPIKIKTELNRDEVAKIETWKIDMPGVAVKTEIKRTNIFGDVASHLLGYISKVSKSELPILKRHGKNYNLGDKIGKAGIEKQLEDTLRGRDGEELIEVDALGRRVRESRHAGVLSKSKALGAPVFPGKNLVLTIDQDLQMVAAQAFGEKAGGLVAIDPRSGEILAMISRPSYNPTEFSRGISPDIWKSLTENKNRPLRDKTIQDHYAPGSVFKVVTAITGLKEGVIDLHTTFNCPGHISLGKRVYHCHKKQGHGNMNVVSALTESCDVFFYRVAQRLKSVDSIAKWARKLGLGRMTNIQLAREVPGLIPTEAWKEERFSKPWNAGETLSVAIGQSFVLTTVIQLANLYAAIGNGGTLFQPFFLKEVETHDGKAVERFQPKVMDQIDLDAGTMKLVRQGMLGVVGGAHGTATASRIQGVDFAGKTGTSQVIRISADRIYSHCIDMKYEYRHHGLFAGFAPVDNPVIAVAVVAEHSCSGSRGAAPIAREVVKAYLEKYYPELIKGSGIPSPKIPSVISPALSNEPEGEPETDQPALIEGEENE